ncbi:MAG: DUF3006 domain-containing protein [Bacilli bacterium]|nr:DUF3006 domain-containing protein [Bacilli bacterium]
MRYVVDRIEDNKVVLEGRVNKRKKIVDLNLLPKGIKDGDILSYKKQIYTILTEETINKTEFMKNRFNKLKK